MSIRAGGEKIQPGDVVIYIDPTRQEHPALVTCVFPKGHIDTGEGEERNVEPALNLVYVDPDEKKEDPYGRQIARATSVVHISDNAAKANCWTDFKEA
jgi:hypothetical protein